MIVKETTGAIPVVTSQARIRVEAAIAPIAGDLALEFRKSLALCQKILRHLGQLVHETRQLGEPFVRSISKVIGEELDAEGSKLGSLISVRINHFNLSGPQISVVFGKSAPNPVIARFINRQERSSLQKSIAFEKRPTGHPVGHLASSFCHLLLS